MKEEERSAVRDEFQRRVRNMGEALITEGIRNIDLVSRGVDVPSTSADVYAHGISGVIRAGQQIDADIRVPHGKPSESPSDLNKLTTDELQSRFETTYVKDKQLESQRMRAAMAGNIEEMNRIIEVEHVNSQLLINLAEALERKGIKPQIPQSASFQSAANQSAEDQAKILKGLQETCKVQ